MKKEWPNPMDKCMLKFIEDKKYISKCDYRQVVCIITEYNKIISYGVNRVFECDKNCHDKVNRLCVVRHAEIEAINYLKLIQKVKLNYQHTVAYVNHFPCEACQRELMLHVCQIRVFGKHHKYDIIHPSIVLIEGEYDN